MATGGEAGLPADWAEDVFAEADEAGGDAPADDARDSAPDDAAGPVGANVSAVEAAGAVEPAGAVDAGEVATGVATLFGPRDALPPQPEIATSATNPQLSAHEPQVRNTIYLLRLN